ncbi:MAG TPA: phenylalanine--tRNA ligase subunit beta [Ferruginibacter sp.]|nr:phenylalanine--tRNA ligase subunit beta [Ferruginibacter sp.]HRO16694.1 phenylalanine--tRNA ligase subunit beta [Ferruginibacter sp.]HRQ19684.1 phenylalanine--tRNA ligase subunit beta [Ferruginibacter sp.]
MTISYNWLSNYLPVVPMPDELSKILTSIGLEVESMERTGGVEGGLEGLIAGEVVSCVPHPDADKLKVTVVDAGQDALLQIVCGAPNVAVGQKVVVATIGTTLYPVGDAPFKIKKSKIRGVESFGMLCAADEIGLGTDHAGILVLDDQVQPGTPLQEVLKPTDEDTIFEIGLTPNRSDAMSHLGVARDVCAYLTHHKNTPLAPRVPYPVIETSGTPPITVEITDPESCTRYSGITIEGVTVGDSPEWLKKRLSAIGVHSINNIVDVTNFILHATGQPLHAFDADQIQGKRIRVKKATEGETFITLDQKSITLTANDLMIYDENAPLCIAGVYGGWNSGVTSSTKNIFLESACFSRESIRITSTHHGLRTDAAVRFEKGTDFSITLPVLSYAIQLIMEVAGGKTAGEMLDVVPVAQHPTKITLSKSYLHTLSGKMYTDQEVESILSSLGYHVVSKTTQDWEVEIPFHKPSVGYAADLVQEIMRISGFDQIDIPSQLVLSAHTDEQLRIFQLREKAAQLLCGAGFNEIFTNSIVNSKWYHEDEAAHQVKLLNSLSAELDILRPHMLQSGLQAIAYNLNRKNDNLRFFEFGKTYQQFNGQYEETLNLSLYLTGDDPSDWKHTPQPVDFFSMKGRVHQLLNALGVQVQYKTTSHEYFSTANEIIIGKKKAGIVAEVHPKWLKAMGIKVPVLYAHLHWNSIETAYPQQIQYSDISRFPSAERDLAIVVDKSVTYSEILQATKQAGLAKLEHMDLFDVFESDKLGTGKKSMAMKFVFSDDTKTFTDEEMDKMMQQLTRVYTQKLNAEVRK